MLLKKTLPCTALVGVGMSTDNRREGEGEGLEGRTGRKGKELEVELEGNRSKKRERGGG